MYLTSPAGVALPSAVERKELQQFPVVREVCFVMQLTIHILASSLLVSHPPLVVRIFYEEFHNLTCCKIKFEIVQYFNSITSVTIKFFYKFPRD